ncbi:MAG: hypothetical protein H6581_18420 [Bacteroidia bacterium]|nr:hypothetical protein [Bacteroidia bacterium]
MKKFLILLTLTVLSLPIFAQEGEEPAVQPQRETVVQTFPNVWIVNTASVETMDKRVMNFRIHHRLGNIRGGLREFFGIDGPAGIYLALDYGITRNLSVGIGRSNLGKILDGWTKYQVLRQEKGGGMPISLSVYGKANMTLLKNPPDNRFGNVAHRMSYIAQVIIARKFGETASLQISPTFIHHNLTDGPGFANSMFGVTAAARFRLSKRLGISAEYGQILNSYLPAGNSNFHPSMGLSLDMLTGGHVFQIVVSNSFDINEGRAIPYTSDNFFNGDLHIGFNIMRSFWL